MLSRIRIHLPPLRHTLGPILAAVLSLLITTPSAAQVTIAVNSFIDEEDDVPGDGLCESPSGLCTLRAAIMEANALGGTVHILLAPGTYSVGIPGGGENAGAVGDFDIFGASVTISGSPTGTTIIDGAGIDRCFDVFNSIQVTLENLTITGGAPGFGAAPGTTSAHGGGLRIGWAGNPPTVVLDDVVFTGNEALLPGGAVSQGGAIWNQGSLAMTGGGCTQNQAKNDGGGISAPAGSQTQLVQVTIDGNDANRGGGVHNAGSMTIDECAVTGNSSLGAGGGIVNPGSLGIGLSLVEGNMAGAGVGSSFGGGIDSSGTLDAIDTTIRANGVDGSGGALNVGSGGVANLTRCTLNGNDASLNGGAIQNLATLTAVNCTLSGNTTPGSGGALYTFVAATSTFVNVTIVGNGGSNSGGIWNDTFAPGKVELWNSILDGNLPADYGGTGPLVAGGVVLVSDGSTGLGAPHLVSTLAMLGPLQANGGPTETHALLAGSPAIDAGSPVDCATPASGPLLEDQRQMPRPVDGDADGIDVCDLGAFEAGPIGPPMCTAGTWNLVPTPTDPGPRSGHTLTFDGARGRAVLFGGFSGSTETWEYDGAWTQVFPPSNPGPHWFSSTTFDAARGVTVLFGGFDNTGARGETWEYDGTDWTLVTTANAPAPRGGAGMAYDANRQVVVLFGGQNAFGTFFGDTWEYNGIVWNQRLPANTPSPRNGASLAFDGSRNVSVLYGGSMGSVYDDTWEWNGANWALVQSGSAPGPRVAHSAAFDPALGRTLVYGGIFTPDDLWGWDGTSWVLIAPTGPGVRTDTNLIHDAARQVVVLHGGSDVSGIVLDDTWEYGCPVLPPGQQFIRGDCQPSLAVDIADPILELGYLFQGQAIPCGAACDFNGDDTLDIADAIGMLQWLFTAGPNPPPPFPGCGPNPPTANLGCTSHACP